LTTGKSFILKVSHGTQVREYSLNQAVTSIGRSPDNTIVLEDELASRRHAEVEFAGGIPRITDLGSSNGTLVNGTRITPNVPHELKDGDSIGIGSYILAVRLLSVPQKVTAPATEWKPAATVSSKTTIPAKSIMPPRGKSLIAVIAGVVVVVAIIVVLVLSPGGMHATVINESATGLIEMHVRAIEELDSNIEETDGKLYAVEEDLLKLDQVVTPCLDWIEIQKKDAMERAIRSSWKYTLDREEMDKLKNDRYIVTKLELEAVKIGLPEQEFKEVLEVVETSTGGSRARDYKQVEAELSKQKQSLEGTRETQLGKREKAMSTMKELAQYWSDSKMEKINSTTFILSGEGLGWSEGFAPGKWTYYRDRNEVAPADNPAKDLMAVLAP
jgi:pSer/pThr/pTyr-binding forkhead associated (FHA) protein